MKSVQIGVLAGFVAIAFGLGFYAGKLSPESGSDSGEQTDRAPLSDPGESLTALSKGSGPAGETLTVAQRVASETEEILADRVPGEANQVLVEKMRGALEEPDRYKRAAHWQSLLSLMREEDIGAIHQLFPESDQKGQWHHMEFEAYWAQRGAVAPDGALNDLKGTGFMAGGPHRYNVMNSWAQNDGPAALARALQENGEGEKASDLFSGAITGWATRDWKSATAALLADVPEGDRAGIVAPLAWSVVYSGGVEEAKKWFGEMSLGYDDNPALVNLAYNTLFEAVARGGGDATADFMVEHAEEPWFYRGALDNVLNNWSRQGPERVLEMIERLPAEEENLRWADKAVGNWTDLRENGIGNWLINNPNSPIYDRVTATFSEQIRSVDPEAARAWMETIEDKALREKVGAILETE